MVPTMTRTPELEPEGEFRNSGLRMAAMGRRREDGEEAG